MRQICASLLECIYQSHVIANSVNTERPAPLSILLGGPRVSPGVTDKSGTNPRAMGLDRNYHRTEPE
jgi:hypothetical protein